MYGHLERTAYLFLYLPKEVGGGGGDWGAWAYFQSRCKVPVYPYGLEFGRSSLGRAVGEELWNVTVEGEDAVEVKRVVEVYGVGLWS